jgi:hypothetical protein
LLPCAVGSVSDDLGRRDVWVDCLGTEAPEDRKVPEGVFRASKR